MAYGGADADVLPMMASAAVKILPRPALAIIQTFDNDIRCDGTDAAHVPEVGASIAKALEIITAASPDVKILVVGQLGRPSIPFVEALHRARPSVIGAAEGRRAVRLPRRGRQADQGQLRLPHRPHRGVRGGGGARLRGRAAVPHGRRRASGLRRQARELLLRLGPPQRQGPGRRGGADLAGGREAVRAVARRPVTSRAARGPRLGGCTPPRSPSAAPGSATRPTATRRGPGRDPDPDDRRRHREARAGSRSSAPCRACATSVGSTSSPPTARTSPAGWA